jgi:hypothetical protein
MMDSFKRRRICAPIFTGSRPMQRTGHVAATSSNSLMLGGNDCVVIENFPPSVIFETGVAVD